jgi:hypothetical protein
MPWSEIIPSRMSDSAIQLEWSFIKHHEKHTLMPFGASEPKNVAHPRIVPQDATHSSSL